MIANLRVGWKQQASGRLLAIVGLKMKQELQDKIFEEFPELFELRRPRKEGEKIVPYICYGLECGDGWYDLIYTLCSQITNHLKWNKKDDEVQVVQVKEKFGGLRFYTNEVPDEVHGMINMAEAMSYRICEVCGSTGSLHKSRWWKTLCDQHHEEREAKNRSQSEPQENEGDE